ncbi:hypothetical protein [Paenibacillus woosongensis]|uniref:Uncharacterized protein n=1 Tax=Paenibacillus woosongensis TaxID=307580 RepID=A0ABQ4MX65_9BACL|nr:hypothetical protein [Paenibacillus woosongensis]GIP60518.1 hypothetical protein J15TS10_43320 [Paenibacillus woosongensis]
MGRARRRGRSGGCECGCGCAGFSKSKVNAGVLQKIAVSMLPFYRAVATSQRFAAMWSRAVVTANLKSMKKLLASAAPQAARQGLGTNGIGYFVDFVFPKLVYTNGTTIPPGTVQFVFEPKVHQAIARAVLSLYSRLASDRAFACKLAIAIRRGNKRLVNLLVRSRVHTAALKAVHIEDEGIALSFKYPFSKFKYRNLLFRDSFFKRRRRRRRLRRELAEE